MVISSNQVCLQLFNNCFLQIQFLAFPQGGPKKFIYMAPCSKCLETPGLDHYDNTLTFEQKVVGSILTLLEGFRLYLLAKAVQAHFVNVATQLITSTVTVFKKEATRLISLRISSQN